MTSKHSFVEELVAQQGGRLRRLLRARVRNTADIPDIIQEVFLRLLRVSNHETIRTLAPAFIVGQLCGIADLDGPALLRRDRSPGVRYHDGYIDCPPGIWGHE